MIHSFWERHRQQAHIHRIGLHNAIRVGETFIVRACASCIPDVRLHLLFTFYENFAKGVAQRERQYLLLSQNGYLSRVFLPRICMRQVTANQHHFHQGNPTQ